MADRARARELRSMILRDKRTRRRARVIMRKFSEFARSYPFIRNTLVRAHNGMVQQLLERTK